MPTYRDGYQIIREEWIDGKPQLEVYGEAIGRDAIYHVLPAAQRELTSIALSWIECYSEEDDTAETSALLTARTLTVTTKDGITVRYVIVDCEVYA